MTRPPVTLPRFAAIPARGLALALLLLLSAPGCGGEEVTPDEELAVDQEALFAATQFIWPSPSIPVCWVNPQDPKAMGWVRDQVENTWQKVSAVRFTGWGACTDADDKSVRIKIGEYWPDSIVGTGAYGKNVSMHLNFTFKTFSSEVCKDRREYCIRAVAAHEFGHALGFLHEQDRPDTHGRCKSKDTDVDTKTIGPWDRHSVMNYCNPDWNGDGKLSPMDIYGVQLTYGLGPDVKQCWAKCSNLKSYHLLKGVVSGCKDKAQSYCKVGDRGKFQDAEWSVTRPQ